MDISAFSKGAGHFVVGDSEALIAILDRLGDVSNAFEADRKARVGLLPGVVLTVQNATQIVLRPVGEVASDLTR
jgi:hypothetical protein